MVVDSNGWAQFWAKLGSVEGFGPHESGAFYAGVNGAQRQKSPDKKGPIKATANRGFRNPETPHPRECRARGPASLTSGLINPKSGRNQKIRPRSYQREWGECGEARGGEGPRWVTW